MKRTAASLTRLSMLALALAVPACSAAGDDTDSSDSEDLTSLTARSRTLKFSGVVFVSQDASDSDIVYAIDKQTQSAFGALRTAKVGVNTRELKVTDEDQAAVVQSFVKTKVSVVDVSKPSAKAQPMMRVAYTYTDQAVVPKPMATRSALTIGLLGAGYQSQVERVTTECTANDSEAREFSSALWYVFDPSQDTCKTAMAKEQQQIDADRAKLTDQKNQVALSEMNRLYIPSTAAFTASPTNTKTKYPEYDQLYSGKGVEDGKLVIGMVSGLMADWAAGEHHDTIDDEGYDMWFQGLREIMTARPGLKLVKSEPAEDFTKFKVGTKTISATDFSEIIGWELDGKFPTGLSSTDEHALRVAIGNKIAQHWLTFEVPTTVTVNGTAKPLTIKLQTYFGASEDSTPHKRAIKTSDVFIYNGHSYIGYGPLDPTNFTEDDFPKTYQILVMNGCVSYNYYEHDFFGLKGGTKNVELITNGLESWVNESGPAMGRLAGSLIDGKFNSYQNVLKAAQFQGMGYDWGQDALRVVDGELDNKFDPKKVSISVK